MKKRFEAIRRALGEDKAREAVALDQISGLVGSPIYREAPRRPGEVYTGLTPLTQCWGGTPAG
jgi:hypothetical protein